MALIAIINHPLLAFRASPNVAVGSGVLEMWCLERDGDREWKLEFDVRYNPT